MAKRAKKSKNVQGNGYNRKQAIADRIKVAHRKCTLLGAQLVKESQKIKKLVAESGRHVDRESAWTKWLETECAISVDLQAVYLALGSAGSSVANFFFSPRRDAQVGINRRNPPLDVQLVYRRVVEPIAYCRVTSGASSNTAWRRTPRIVTSQQRTYATSYGRCGRK